MSLEQLRADMKDNAGQLAKLTEAAVAGEEVSTKMMLVFLRDTMWPTMEAMVEEVGEIDGCVEDLLHAQEDILQPETAELFAALVVAGRAVAAELAKRLRPDDGELREVLESFEQLSKSAEEAIEQITIPDEGEDDEEEDDQGAKS